MFFIKCFFFLYPFFFHRNLVSLVTETSKSSLYLNIPINESYSLNLTFSPANEGEDEKKGEGGEGGKVVESNRNRTIQKSLEEANKTMTSYKNSSLNAELLEIKLSNGSSFYYGSFVFDVKNYEIEPMFLSNATNEKYENIINNFTISNALHILIEANISKTDQKNDEIPSSPSVSTSPLVTVYEVQLHQQIPITSGKMFIELMMLLDFSVYNKWFGIFNNKREAIENIKYYYIHVVNGVRLNYEKIKDHDLQLTVHLSILYISETTSDDPYSLDPTVLRGNLLDSRMALGSTQNFLNERIKRNKFPTYDTVVVFTDYDTPGINGLGFIEGTCKQNGISVVKDNGASQTINTATHEMGHNLGSFHDSENNECRFEDQFIMASSRDKPNEKNFMNLDLFSHCSLRNIRAYIQKMNSQKFNCLTNYPLLSSPHDPSEYLSQYPGQKFNIDQQCQILFGKSYSYCGGEGPHIKDFCEKMSCYNPSLRSCSITERLIPADGTPCGNRKWCINRKCVPDSRAPRAKEYCRLGDFKPGIADRSGRKIPCNEFISKNPGVCYTGQYREWCCETCLKLKDEKRKDCEYGDKNPYCEERNCLEPNMARECCKTCEGVDLSKPETIPGKCSKDSDPQCPNMKPYQCYESRVRILCCHTCLKFFKPELKNCEYGDKVNWCELKLQQFPNDCNKNYTKTQCCFSCLNNKHQPNNLPKPNPPSSRPFVPGVTCEDERDCRNMRSYDCYNENIQKDCCRTCASFQTSLASCKYGDHNSFCIERVKKYPHDCRRVEEIKKMCCKSCGDFLSSPTCVDTDNCSDISAKDCYDPEIENPCCATCKAFSKGRSGVCKYGNRYKKCKTSHCKDTFYKTQCCEIC